MKICARRFDFTTLTANCANYANLCIVVICLIRLIRRSYNVFQRLITLI